MLQHLRSYWKYALLAGFGVQLVLVLTVVAVGLRSIQETQEQMQALVARDLQKLVHSQTMNHIANERLLVLFLMLESDDPFLRDEQYTHFLALAGRFVGAREALRQLPLTTVEQDLLTQQGKYTRDAQPHLEKVAELALARDDAQARKILRDRVAPLHGKALAALDKLDQNTRNSVQDAIRWAERSYSRIRQRMLWLSAVIVLIGLTSALGAIYLDRRAARQREHLATHDSLTGLPNRSLYMDRLQRALTIAGRRNRMVGVAFVDLDQLKSINDTWGHDAGDALICEAARRLQSSVRPGDVVARLAGDEFALIIGDVRETDEVVRVLERIKNNVAAPLHIGEFNTVPSCSIGASVYPHDGLDTSQLLKKADRAMYHAKRAGRNTFRLYDPQMDS